MPSHGKAPAHTVAVYGLLLALALIFSYVETLVPVHFAVPGVKLGLANTVAVFALYKLRARDAWAISAMRVLLASLLFGSALTFFYSMAGACMSLLVMQLVRKSERFSPVGVSVCGGVAHNVGQILMAVFLLETGSLVYYLPVLCVSGVASGVVIGAAAGMVIQRVRMDGKK